MSRSRDLADLLSGGSFAAKFNAIWNCFAICDHKLQMTQHLA